MPKYSIRFTIEIAATDAGYDRMSFTETVFEGVLDASKYIWWVGRFKRFVDAIKAGHQTPFD